MSTLKIPPFDLELGATSSINHEEDDDDGGGSCCSQFYSIADSYDDCEISEQGVESRRASSVALSDFSVEIANVGRQVKLVFEGGEMDCRICHMGLESTHENGPPIQLGCSCKHDLAAAHQNCAEAWFKIRGNKTCEICNSMATNVVGLSVLETIQQTNEIPSAVSSYVTEQVTSSHSDTTRRCLNGHRFVNFLLACMVFAFVISWLFHFNIPS